MGGLARWSFRRYRVSVWDLSGLKDIFQVLHQLLILSMSAEREVVTACLSEGGEIMQ